MSKIASNNANGLSMRQTLAFGLLAGLSAAAVHTLTRNGTSTEYLAPGSASLLQHEFGQASAPTGGKIHYALHVETTPNPLSAEREAAAGPRQPQHLATRIQKVPGLLWRL
jgi:hypothetical protein